MDARRLRPTPARARALLAVAPMVALGICSGLPLPLSSFTLQQWLVTAGASTRITGTVTALGLAYVLKFCWSPLFDRVPPGALARLGRRRGWLLPIQLLLAAAIAALALTDPASRLWPTLALAGAVAFLSASQDIVIDAWRIDTYPEATQGAALAAYVWGYRAVMLAMTSGIIFLSTTIGWHAALLGASVIPLAGAALTLSPWLREPRGTGAATAGHGITAFVEPLRELLARPGIATLLGFVILFRLGKVLADGTAAAFYRHGLGFTSVDVAAANFLPGIAGFFAGAAAGGFLVARMGTWPALVLTGALQSASLLLYLALLATGAAPLMLDAKVGLEAFAEVAASMAFLSFISARCSTAHSASQYAVLSALSALVFHTVGATGGFFAERLGFIAFYAACFLLSLPALALLLPLRSKNEARQDPSKAEAECAGREVGSSIAAEP